MLGSDPSTTFWLLEGPSLEGQLAVFLPKEAMAQTSVPLRSPSYLPRGLHKASEAGTVLPG